MKNLKRTLAIVVTLLSIATPCLAEENAMRTIFEDSFYGGLAGGLVGAATLAFTNKPGDHLQNVGIGAGIGVIIGAVYGAVTTSRSLAEYDNGKVKFAIPTIHPEIREGNAKGQSNIVAMAELLRGKF
ncbi:hypothetical protein [Geomonas propionica]|uniref:Glycine zipper family protein n=1 Tax=Geomonas propionica TaxID=2798582 RepID=A0ABS0YR27_9BACT|nr:hypothetical protein [Geomonas propionica]MBJ6800222.1 hypothetical protein [Geomonas propionica]